MSSNAANSFRSQLSGFRWANSVQDDSTASSQPATGQGNVFSRSWNSVSGYIPLRNEGASREEEAYFALSVSLSGDFFEADFPAMGTVRMRNDSETNVPASSGSSLAVSAAWPASALPSSSCPSVCYWRKLPQLTAVAVKPRKFALAFTLGSCLFMLGFAILHGPMARKPSGARSQLTADLNHIISKERLPFSIAYFGSLALTLYFAIGLRSTIGTLIAALVQVAALLTYLAAYLPGGVVTLRMGSQMLLRGAGNVLPV